MRLETEHHDQVKSEYNWDELFFSIISCPKQGPKDTQRKGVHGIRDRGKYINNTKKKPVKQERTKNKDNNK